MSERTYDRALAPYGRPPALTLAAWRGAATASIARVRALFGAAASRRRRPRANRAAAALAGLDDHILADIGIHRSQIPALARAVAERPEVDPRGGGS
jgi:uncharacterized protein YjiS (DUF1127 family)